MILVPILKSLYHVYESVGEALEKSDTYIIPSKIKFENSHVEIDGIIYFNNLKKQRKYHVIEQDYKFVFRYEETNMEEV